MKEQIFSLRAEGKSYSQIQAITGASKGTIAYHLGAGVKEKTLQRSKNARNNITNYIQEYKQVHPCVDCGEDYPYWMKDFDHLGDKSFDISKFKDVTSRLDVVIEEMKKCDVVCSNCHRNRTHLRRLDTGKNEGIDIDSFYEDIHLDDSIWEE